MQTPVRDLPGSGAEFFRHEDSLIHLSNRQLVYGATYDRESITTDEGATKSGKYLEKDKGYSTTGYTDTLLKDPVVIKGGRFEGENVPAFGKGTRLQGVYFQALPYEVKDFEGARSVAPLKDHRNVDLELLPSRLLDAPSDIKPQDKRAITTLPFGARMGNRSMDYIPAYPVGTQGIVVPGTDPDGVYNYFLSNTNPILIAHHNKEAPPQYSTHVFEMSGKEVDPNMHAGLHSIFRVKPIRTGSYGIEGEFGICLFGSQADDESGYLPFVSRSTLSSSGPPPGFRGSFVKPQVTNPPATDAGLPMSIGLLSWEKGGFIFPGLLSGDTHNLGYNLQGEAVNMGKIATDALFQATNASYARDYDMPLRFRYSDEPDMEPVEGYPIRVFLMRNPREKHYTFIGDKPNWWEWHTFSIFKSPSEVNNYVDDKPGNEDPDPKPDPEPGPDPEPEPKPDPKPPPPKPDPGPEPKPQPNPGEKPPPGRGTPWAEVGHGGRPRPGQNQVGANDRHGNRGQGQGQDDEDGNKDDRGGAGKGEQDGNKGDGKAGENDREPGGKGNRGGKGHRGQGGDRRGGNSEYDKAMQKRRELKQLAKDKLARADAANKRKNKITDEINDLRNALSNAKVITDRDDSIIFEEDKNTPVSVPQGGKNTPPKSMTAGEASNRIKELKAELEKVHKEKEDALNTAAAADKEIADIESKEYDVPSNVPPSPRGKPSRQGGGGSTNRPNKPGTGTGGNKGVAQASLANVSASHYLGGGSGNPHGLGDTFPTNLFLLDHGRKINSKLIPGDPDPHKNCAETSYEIALPSTMGVASAIYDGSLAGNGSDGFLRWQEHWIDKQYNKFAGGGQNRSTGGSAKAFDVAPLVIHTQHFGHQGKTDWVYVTEPESDAPEEPSATDVVRFRMHGTSNGGSYTTPPDHMLEDGRSKSHSTYVGYHPSIIMAWGDVRVSGGDIVNGFRSSFDGTDFHVTAVDASGVADVTKTYIFETPVNLSGGSTSFGGDILPDTDLTYNIGSPTFRWKDIYAEQIDLEIGSAAAPAVKPRVDTNTGIYFGGADDIYASLGGVNRFSMSGSRIVAGPIAGPTGQFVGGDGAVGSSGLAFYAAGSYNTGLFCSDSELGMSMNVFGVQIFSMTNIGACTMPNSLGTRLGVPDGLVSACGLGFTADANTGLIRTTTDTMGLVTGGVTRRTISTTVETFTLPQQGAAGSAPTPTYSFSGDTNTGIYSHSADALGFTTGGVARMRLTTAALLPNSGNTYDLGSSANYWRDVYADQFDAASNGSETLPVLKRVTDTDTGVFFPAANTLGLAVGGSTGTNQYYSVSATSLTLPANNFTILPFYAPVGSNGFNLTIKAGAGEDGFTGGTLRVQAGGNVAGADAHGGLTEVFGGDGGSTLAVRNGGKLSTRGGNAGAGGGGGNGGDYELDGGAKSGFGSDGTVKIATIRGGLTFGRSGMTSQSNGSIYINTNGSAASPSLQIGATNKGLFNDGASGLGIATAGVERANFNATRSLFSQPIDMPEVSSPASPSANTSRLYTVDESGITNMSYKDSGGAITNLGHAFASITVTSDSTAAATEYDVFDADNYPAFSNTVNVEAKDIAYTSTDGRFTVTAAGKYKIDCVLYLESAAIQTVFIDLNKSGATIWTSGPTVHSSVDPLERTISIIVDANASDYFNVTVDGASGNVTIKPGTTFSIHRVN